VWGYDLFYRPGSKEYWEEKGAHTVVGDFTKGEFGGLPTDADYCINLAANTMPGNYSIGLRDNALGPALLMQHCKDVKAFMHFSSCAQYTPADDPMTAYTEEDAVGSKAEGYYSGTKIAGEGAVKAMAHVLRLPTIQLRLSVFYGTHGDGGLLTLVYLNNLVNGLPIEIIQGKPSYFNVIYDKDINLFMEPLLNAATTEAPIVNFIGDDLLSVEDMVAYMSELTGIVPEYKYVDELSWPTMIISPEKRKSITGPASYPWKKGVKELVEYWLPRLQAEQAQAQAIAADIRGKYTQATRLKEIRDLPGIVGFLSEHSGMKVPPYALKVGGGMTLQKAGVYLKWNGEQVQKVVDELNAKYS
jgi:nucleoside-diphosphate-sugar epimerase